MKIIFEKKDFRFTEKEKAPNRVRLHCHISNKHRGPVHNRVRSMVHRNEVIFFHLPFTISVKMIVIFSSKI